MRCKHSVIGAASMPQGSGLGNYHIPAGTSVGLAMSSRRLSAVAEQEPLAARELLPRRNQPQQELLHPFLRRAGPAESDVGRYAHVNSLFVLPAGGGGVEFRQAAPPSGLDHRPSASCASCRPVIFGVVVSRRTPGNFQKAAYIGPSPKVNFGRSARRRRQRFNGSFHISPGRSFGENLPRFSRTASSDPATIPRHPAWPLQLLSLSPPAPSCP